MIQNAFFGNAVVLPESLTKDERQWLEEIDAAVRAKSRHNEGATALPPGTYYLTDELAHYPFCVNPQCSYRTERQVVLVSRHQCRLLLASCSFECDQAMMPLVFDLTPSIYGKARRFLVSHAERKQRVKQRLPSILEPTLAGVILLLLRERQCHWCQKAFPIESYKLIRPGHIHLYPDAPTFDHIIPRSLGGSLGLENVCIACHACNQERKPAKFDHAAPKPTDKPILKSRQS